jgi:hypothetical protein
VSSKPTKTKRSDLKIYHVVWKSANREIQSVYRDPMSTRFFACRSLGGVHGASGAG